QAGTFREDLYYRISGWHQSLVPLRAWPEDERQGLIRTLLAEMDPALAMDEVAERQLLAYPLPGNVRQLKLVLEVACVLAEGQGVIRASHLHLPALPADPPVAATGQSLTLREQGRLGVQQTLAACGGNVSEAARRLGISRTTLYRALKEGD
ncbi:MAG: helix-turn-helix domain-containing protein, partial [Aeromonas sp.]